jgi:hypothetical protein
MRIGSDAFLNRNGFGFQDLEGHQGRRGSAQDIEPVDGKIGGAGAAGHMASRTGDFHSGCRVHRGDGRIGNVQLQDQAARNVLDHLFEGTFRENGWRGMESEYGRQ